MLKLAALTGPRMPTVMLCGTLQVRLSLLLPPSLRQRRPPSPGSRRHAAAPFDRIQPTRGPYRLQDPRAREPMPRSAPGPHPGAQPRAVLPVAGPPLGAATAISSRAC